MRGSNFTLLVPLEVAGDSAEPEVNLPGTRVLVVDANASSRASIQEKLAVLGIDSIAVDNAAEAIGRLRLAVSRNKGFHAILIDSTLADAEGLELAELVRADRQFDDLRLLMFAPMSGAEAIESLDANLGVECLTKPIRRTVLEGWLHGRTEDDFRATREANPQSQSLTGACRRILVAEDNPINQHLTLESLRMLGVEPVLVGNGKQALEKLEEEDFDVVLMDCQMPVMDGYEATRRLRAKEQETGEHHLVIALTANAMRGDREKCIEAGMDDYLSKPFSNRAAATHAGEVVR